MTDSYQNKLSRIRRPRVHITYNVETEGAEKKIELPYIIGVITNLSGDTILSADREMKFRNVDTDNLDEYLEKQEATLQYAVHNVLENKGNISINLKFTNMDSLSIINVIKQVPELNEYYYKIQVISKIATMASNNSKLADFLLQVINENKTEILANAIKDKLSQIKPQSIIN